MSVPGEVCSVPGRKTGPGLSQANRHARRFPLGDFSCPSGPVHLKGLSFELLRECVPHGGLEVQDWTLFVLGVAHGDRGGRCAHLDAVALAAGVAGYPPARDRLVAHSSLLILVMSCAESIGDSAHPLIMLSAVAMAVTSLGSLMTLPEPHPSR